MSTRRVTWGAFAALAVLASWAVMSGCASHAKRVDCEAKLVPINMPASSAAVRDAASGAEQRAKP